ncbi:MAG: prohibitin family protein [Clostridia bacterium]|nr:prohibitin family protein [Clostridia bacterium]MBQ4341686.1 prohibitin family protein [Clostridia bacterium]
MKNVGKVLIAVAAAVLVAVLAISCTATVPTGYTGIVTTFGRVEDHTFDAGFHIKSPFQKVVKMDNRTQKAVEALQAFSSDIQQVDISIAVNYSIDQSTAEKLYKTVGEEYYSKILYPRLLENTKSVFSKYTAEKLVAYRETLSSEITELVVEDVKDYGINVSSIAVQDIDFTDAFTNAVEAKQVAQQNKLTAQTQQDQLTMEAQQEAERQVIKAKADAEKAKIAAEADLEVTKIQADAAEYAGQKEAAKNKAISQSLTSELVRYYYIQQWNGQLPQTMLGEGSSVLYGLD